MAYWMDPWEGLTASEWAELGLSNALQALQTPLS